MKVRRKARYLLRICRLGSEGIKTQKCIFVLNKAWLTLLYKIGNKKNLNALVQIRHVLNYKWFFCCTIGIAPKCAKISTT